ncbi:hypothetical protein BC829DRAFT_213055 [Chytridium lagenaria]|nr:hypothetical protein BC829DRAFT_213055 [Chytridium lagenaria]
MPFFKRRDTMVLGVDLTHPGPGSLTEKARSIAAVVGSIDPDLCVYRAECGHIPARQSVIPGLGNLVRPLIEKYQDSQGCLPSRIICFRDGVSRASSAKWPCRSFRG